MARACTVCAHQNISAINALLIQGESHQRVANQFGLKRMAIARHYANHVACKTPLGPVRDAIPAAQPAAVSPVGARSQQALAQISRYEPRIYFLRQLDRVEKLIQEAEADGARGHVLGGIEASRKLYGDAFQLFMTVEEQASQGDTLLQDLRGVIETEEEKQVFATLLLRLRKARGG